MMQKYLVGVDVGTGSARAGVFDEAGTLLAHHKQDIQLWRESADRAEQSSADIWSAVCLCVREAVTAAGVAAEAVVGIGFDAACSMVVLDKHMSPLSISASGDHERNVIVWMDHRAHEQAERINKTGHRVLDFVGGRISPEMQTPKLLWLAENMPDTFTNAGQFFDLPDFLTWCATGSLTRSACTVTCKWTYLAHKNGWDDSYFEQIGLGQLAKERYARIGKKIVSPGTCLEQGLSAKAATAMGLNAGIAVAAGLIDAHAGGIGTVGADSELGPENTMAYVFGTSACTMSTSSQPKTIPGIWGPYFSAMVPGLWLSEGGQSAAGEAIAHILDTHPASADAKVMAAQHKMSLPAFLLHKAEAACVATSNLWRIAGSRVIIPDFLGNRAPFSDPNATAVISGLTTEKGIDDLVKSYVATLFGIGYGLRQILDIQAAHGLNPSAVVISGGAGESATIKQMLADACDRTMIESTSPEPVLLGAAMLAAVASQLQPSLPTAMKHMSSIARKFEPNIRHTAEIHRYRYLAFKTLQSADRELRKNLALQGTSKN